MLGLYIMAAIIAGVAAIIAPFKLRATLRGRLRSGSFELSHGARVTVVGTIRETTELVDSPISTRRGVFVYARAELPEAGPGGLLEEIRMKPFELDTMHGVVLVDAIAADIVMKLVAATRSPELQRNFVASHGRGPEVANVASFREVVLIPGRRIAVNGVALLEDAVHGERGYRDPVATKIRIVAPPQNAITIGEPSDRY